ncbi:hypothetical protein ACLOJK_029539 [Asimina triloba]
MLLDSVGQRLKNADLQRGIEVLVPTPSSSSATTPSVGSISKWVASSLQHSAVSNEFAHSNLQPTPFMPVANPRHQQCIFTAIKLAVSKKRNTQYQGGKEKTKESCIGSREIDRRKLRKDIKSKKV